MSKFADIYGHEQIKEHLQNAIRLNKVSHAYIFNGPMGSGKKMTAGIFAETLQCERHGQEPCGTCHSCIQSESGNQPDIIWVHHENPGSIGVDDVREQVIGDMQIKPYSSRYKIYIIDEAEKLTQAVTGAIENLQDHLSLEEADVYKKPTVLKDDASLAEQLDKMNKYAKMSVTYQFGDSTETLNGDQIHAWLIANADGSVSVDSSKVSEYVSEMAKAHNTSNKAKTLKTSYGSTIQVSGGTYGWKINQAAETEALAAIIASGESTTREPEYSQKAASHGANDYGDTYVEINLTGQHLFFYKEGKLVVESDFVSGNLAKGWGTPAGSYPLAYKQKNAVLKGENYRTPVNYWMPFNNGIGMHDAKWRSSFGGTIYKTGGSHGCINLPPSVAKTIFDNISAGTPVICYNLPGTEKSTTSGTAKPAETKPAETQAPAETAAPPETQAPAPAETQAPGPAPTTAPTQAETKAPETAAPTQAGPGGPSGDNGGNIAVGPGA